MSIQDGYLAIYGGYPDGSTRAEFYPNAEVLNREVGKYKEIRTVACVLRIDPNSVIQVERDFRDAALTEQKETL